MDTLDDLARTLGLSKRAVRVRIDALNGLLDAHIHRGRRNQLIFTDEAVLLLRRLEELRHAERIPIRQAAARLRDELGESRITRGKRSEAELTAEIKTEYLKQIVKVLRQERDYWREVAHIAQSALPADRMWISKLFPPSANDQRLN